MNDIASLYSTSLSGGELPYFIGKQYGAGWFRNIARMAFPILKKFGSALVNTASDWINDKKILPSLKRNVVDAAKESVPDVISLIKNDDKQSTKVPPRKKSINKRRKLTIF